MGPEISRASIDAALEFWKALDEVFPSTCHQRCWCHKTNNILDKAAKCRTDAERRERRIGLNELEAQLGALQRVESFVHKDFEILIGQPWDL